MQTRNKRQAPVPLPERAAPAKRRKAKVAAAPRTRNKAAHAEESDPSDDESKESPEDQESSYMVPAMANSRKVPPPPTVQCSMPSISVFSNAYDNSQRFSGVQSRSASMGVADDDDGRSAALRKVMMLSLPNLRKEAEELIHHLRNLGRESEVFLMLLKPKRNAFLGYREIYSSAAHFIDWAELGALETYENWEISPNKVFAYANLASALDMIDQIQSGAKIDILLSELDDFLHKLFTPFGDSAESSDIALNMRTLRFVDALSRSKKTKADAYHLLATIFCEEGNPDVKVDYAHLFAHGPFKRISNQEHGEVDHITNHVTDIISDLGKGKGAVKSELLEEKYTLDGVLNQLKKRILEVYDRSRNDIVQAVPDAYPNTGEDGESQSQFSQYQRIEGSQGQTLFQNLESIQTLRNFERSVQQSIPPSNQHQQHASASTVPRYFVDDNDNESMLGAQPASVADSQAASESVGAQPMRPSRRPNNTFSIDDEDGGFETDNRPIDMERQTAISHSLQAQVQAQDQVRPHNPSPREKRLYQSSAVPSSPMGPPPPPSQYPHSSSTVVPPSQFAALKEEKRLLTQAVRASYPESPKQRVAWSDADCTTLVELIGTRQAAWSAIESCDNAMFEHPRDQQAYRDKARNLKVDYLLTNAVLPPSFDLVTLGKKEIARLIKYGKNPFRKEKHISEDGNPIKTEYVPPPLRE